MKSTDKVSSQSLLGRWIHAHEEDPQDGFSTEVYRPSDWPLGPSRGRRGFELYMDGRAILLDIAATDGTDPLEGSWTVEQGRVLVIDADGEVRRWTIEQATVDCLVLRGLR